MSSSEGRIAIIGAGIVGIATAYYLIKQSKAYSVYLIDSHQPMTFTSANSGENYRNWWPHSTMTAFTNLSIDLMEEIARESENRIHMTRRGYALVTRRTEIDDLFEDLYNGYSQMNGNFIRVHDSTTVSSYQPANFSDWTLAPDGVDIIRNKGLIQMHFPNFAMDIKTIIHIRRAGDISSQQLGQHMIEVSQKGGLRRITGSVRGIEMVDGFKLDIKADGMTQTLKADILINAAGPFVEKIARMIGFKLPVQNILQQKIAFEDKKDVLPRNLPFSVDIDSQMINWIEEERKIIADNPMLAHLIKVMPGGIHCRPEGGGTSRWIKLGWAYSREKVKPKRDLNLDDHFPEIVLRGASRLQPSLKTYFGRLTRQMKHYGGYYTMTEENWPLIGPIGPKGSYIVGALSGYGTMAACATGYITARLVNGGTVPDYTSTLGFDRYAIPELLSSLKKVSRKSLL